MALAGARKSIDYKLNGTSVVVIATVNGCGGGILHDVLCARVSRVLHEDFYATAALAGAALMVVVLMKRFGMRRDLAGTIAGVTIFALRTAALLGAWRLPHLR
ncbi:MAG: TRIC cation channel family protein [Sphingomonas bacterium]